MKVLEKIVEDKKALNGSSSADRRLFLLIILLTSVLVVFLCFLTYAIPAVGLQAMPPFIRWSFVSLLLLGGVSILVVLLSLFVVVIRGRDIPLPMAKKLRSIAIKYFLPLFIVVGRLIGVSKEEVQHAFVRVNNELVMAYCRDGHLPRRILLLMPHCLQNSECPVKITYRVQNCKRCGRCVIKDLLEISERYGTALSVATGGTIARRIVVETRPDLIIAVACERDLTSGIQDTAPLPVYGIFNRRPHGPCFNTQVDVKAIEEVLEEIRGGEVSPPLGKRDS